MSVKLLTVQHLEFLEAKIETAQAGLSLHFQNDTLLEIRCHGSIINKTFDIVILFIIYISVLVTGKIRNSFIAEKII